MDKAIKYASCIKMPTNSKQDTSKMFSLKLDIKEAIAFNNELILLANRIFGDGKWSHTVTNQTIDFIEAFMGKYVCGCATFVKIQLQNGIFHEDMGYCHAEGAIKGSAIHAARIGSLTDAFKKTLFCFHSEVGTQMHKLSKKLENLHVPVNQKEDLHYSLANVPVDLLEPCARSTPIQTRANDEATDKPVNSIRSKSPSVRSRSPIVQKEQSVLTKNSNGYKNQMQLNGANYQKEHEIAQKEQESRLTEEELLRLERKRKQMEKQAEFKRQMKEREQKSSDIKEANSKY